MRTAATIAGFLLICGGVAALAWPAPLFTLNEPYLTWYMENVLKVDGKPGGAGAALPFLWIMTAPLGLAGMAIGTPIMCWGQRRL